MHSTIEKLIEGDSNIIAYYAKAKELWDEILAMPEAKTVEGLANMLGSYQLRFEHECGGRSLGQEIMVIHGIAQDYSTTSGFEPDASKAKKIAEAFEQSRCSIEVQGLAVEVAASYYLEEF